MLSRSLDALENQTIVRIINHRVPSFFSFFFFFFFFFVFFVFVTFFVF